MSNRLLINKRPGDILIRDWLRNLLEPTGLFDLSMASNGTWWNHH